MQMPLSLEDFKRAFCYGDTRTNERGAVVHPGTSAGKDVCGIARYIPDGCREVKEWEDGPFRSVWVNDTKRYTITYCEGDVYLVTCETPEIYDAEIAHAATFYATH
jgi:hypothetical protein